MKDSPEIVKPFAIDQIRNVLGQGYAGEDEEGEDIYPGSSIRGLIEQIDEYDELNQRLGRGGAGGGLIASVLNPETLQSVFGFLTAFMNQPSGGMPERGVIVKLDDQMREVSESEYRQLLAENRIKPVGEVTAPSETHAWKVTDRSE